MNSAGADGGVLLAIHALSGVGSVALGTALTYPLDTIKTLIQVDSGSSKQLTTSYVLKRVRYFSGNSGLYNGFLWLAAGRTLGLGAHFGTYEILTAFYKDGREDNYVYVSEALLAGLVAGVAESLISSPFDLIKLRAQVTSASCIPNSAPLPEKGAVVPVIQNLLRGCSPDMKALNSSVALLSTLTTKHPNMTGALQGYPWMMTGSGKPPSVFSVRKHLKSSLWKDGVHYGEVYGQELFGIQFLVAYSFLLGNLCTMQCLTGRQWGWILNPGRMMKSVHSLLWLLVLRLEYLVLLLQLLLIVLTLPNLDQNVLCCPSMSRRRGSF